MPKRKEEVEVLVKLAEYRPEKTEQGIDTRKLVEKAILKLALGYQKEEIIFKDGVEEKRVCKEVGPSFTALKFWLETHASDEWGNHENTAKALIEATLAQMTRKELQSLLLATNE
ncbi:MAG: hypothetical protein MJ157_02055 [Clostridia bacterium]|nr:hypothetical protein [Clostridia bacterium]